MDYKMEELIPIVADLAKKYAGCDNTSITYEAAQALMQGVIYCLDEYWTSTANSLWKKDISIQEQYQIGTQLVREKTNQVLRIHNELTVYFDDYHVVCLHDTVQKGIPEFLKWYDAKFFPQNTILTLDYPILENIQSKCGVDAVYVFICSIQTEQKFLRLFDRNYIISVLKEAIPDYEDMIENICSIVLMNAIGHMVLGKSFCNFGFHKDEYKKLSDIFSLHSISDIECLLQKMVHKMLLEMGESDNRIYDYLCCEIKNMAVRIDHAVKYNHMDKIFVL